MEASRQHGRRPENPVSVLVGDRGQPSFDRLPQRQAGGPDLPLTAHAELWRPVGIECMCISTAGWSREAASFPGEG